MTRSEILDTAKETVISDRNKQYGEPEDILKRLLTIGPHILINKYLQKM